MLIMKLTTPLCVSIICSVEKCEEKGVGDAEFVVSKTSYLRMHRLGESLRKEGWKLLFRKVGVLRPPGEPEPVDGYTCVCPFHSKEKPKDLKWKQPGVWKEEII